MACERQFLARDEDADAIVGAGDGRRQQEDGFRQIRPGRECLHPCVVELFAVEDGAQRVSSARAVGEDIHLQITKRHHDNGPGRIE